MPKYKIAVEMTHTWTTTEDFEVEVEAKDQVEALHLANEEAYRESDPDLDTWDAERESCIDNMSVIDVEYAVNEVQATKCKKTYDMFAQL